MKESTPRVATIKEVCLIVKAIELPAKILAENLKKKPKKEKRKRRLSSTDYNGNCKHEITPFLLNFYEIRSDLNQNPSH